jgi:preprotein translocase subunit YajC
MIFLQAQGEGRGSMMPLLLLMMGIFLVVQFVIVGPKQKKREKEMAAFIDGLSNGSKIITTSGIHGKYIKSEENLMVVEIDTNVKVRMEKTALNYEATKALNGVK